MRLGYFTMPLHPFERDTTETLHEDRETIIYADQLGFYDAFVGEHLTDKAENVTNSLIFLATLIAQTKNIKLGSGTSNLSHSLAGVLAALGPQRWCTQQVCRFDVALRRCVATEHDHESESMQVILWHAQVCAA